MHLGALDAKGGVEASHHSLNIDIRRKDTKVAGRRGAACAGICADPALAIHASASHITA
jgi:hypothetical protein